MAAKLKVSVVTVCYNCVKDIEQTMQSVLGQTYENIEYIVIDGGSTDGTVDIIRKYADRIDYWVSEPDKGIYDAMNKGIAHATGDYINFMNAGDNFVSNETLENCFGENEYDADIIYGNAIYNYGDFKLLFKPKALSLFPKRFPISHQASFVRTSIMKDCPYDPAYKSSADYDFFLKRYRAKDKFHYLPIAIAEFEAETGISSSQILLRRKECGIINGLGGGVKYRLVSHCINLKYRIRHNLQKLFPTLVSEIRRKKLIKAGSEEISLSPTV